MSEKCKVQKFKLRDFAVLDEIYKRMNNRMNEIMFRDSKKIDPEKKTIKIKVKDKKSGDIKEVSKYDVELTDLMGEAINGEDLITIVKCGTNGCDLDKLDWDEGLRLFKEIVTSEENKDFFLKSYEAKMTAINPRSASSRDSGTSSTPSSEKE